MVSLCITSQDKASSQLYVVIINEICNTFSMLFALGGFYQMRVWLITNTLIKNSCCLESVANHDGTTAEFKLL